jgi:hypothetical protein
MIDHFDIIGHRIVHGEAPQFMEISVPEQLLEQLNRMPLDVRFKTEPRATAVFLDAELVRACLGPVALYRSFYPDGPNEPAAENVPNAVALEFPLDPNLLLVISRENVWAVPKSDLAEP